MSKKENKELAKEQRALARKKEEERRIIGIVIGVLLVVACIASLVIATIATKPQETADTEIVNPDETDTSVQASTAVPTLDTTEGRIAENGDIVNIDYVGYITETDEAFEGGDTHGGGADLELGSGTYVPGFEEGVVGHAVGETFDVPLTFPENYYPELAGKDVYFRVTLNGIYE